MIRKSNHTGPVRGGKPPGRGKGKGGAAALPAAAGLLLLLAGACRAPSASGKGPLPEGLPSVMEDFRALCREVVRARATDRPDRLPALAASMEKASARLLALAGGTALAPRAEAFSERVRRFRALLPPLPGTPASGEEVERAFGRVADGCLACHLEFRPE